ncbi:hypothetical protein RDI58_024279 [Solanum bulbocastanum]|uniref:Uncharacterized protein n=1 Tax=Solanum bulbocastanum TaxID=147425 RepID=A0AAN8T5J6_SOLBU
MTVTDVMKESSSTFNKGDEKNGGPNIVVGDEILSGEDPFTTTPQTIDDAATRVSSTTTPINTTNPSTIDPTTIDLVTADPTNADPNEIKIVGDDDEDYGSDVHEEVRELRAKKKTFRKRKRNERVPTDTKEVYRARIDLNFDETETGKISFEERLGDDEQAIYTDNVEIDENECCDEDEHYSSADSSDSSKVSLHRRVDISRRGRA